MNEFVAGVVPVESSSGTAQAVPIGLNNPLRVEIKDVWTGDYRAGEALLTTAVKSAATYDAQPLAIQAIHRLERRPQHLPFRAQSAGSPIVHYSKAVLDRELLVDVRLDFDRFDEDRYNSYAAVLAKAIKLPVFLGAGALGGMSAAGAAAAVFLAESGMKVLFNAIDRWRDGDNPADLAATFKINFDSPGEVATTAGYYLCWNDGTRFEISPQHAWENNRVVAGSHGEEFSVNSTGKLIYRQSRERVDNVRDAYVLLHISGTKDDKLADFQPVAASAALLKKFVGTEGSLVEDFAELAEAYNDFVFLRRVKAIDAEIAAATEVEKAGLVNERAATLKHIQSREVQELLKL
jgi:hypothetical protein